MFGVVADQLPLASITDCELVVALRVIVQVAEASSADELGHAEGFADKSVFLHIAQVEFERLKSKLFLGLGVGSFGELHKGCAEYANFATERRFHRDAQRPLRNCCSRDPGGGLANGRPPWARPRRLLPRQGQAGLAFDARARQSRG